MNDKERAIASIKKLALRKLDPAKKKLEEVAKNKLEDFGLNTDAMGKALALANIARTGKLKGSYKLGENTRLDGELDARKKAIRLGLTHDF